MLRPHNTHSCWSSTDRTRNNESANC